jgi:hypothetical protein
VTIPIPQGTLKTGENKLILGFAQSGRIAGQKASAAVEWIAVGAAAADPPPTLADTHGLHLDAGDVLAYYVQIPRGGSLVLEADGACRPEVRAFAANPSGGVSDHPTLSASAASGTPLDLGALAGRVVRLELAGNTGCKGATIKGARLMARGAAPTVQRPSRPRNVVFWMTDSTRADKYKAFNPRTRVETPVMEEFARRATLFKVAYVQGNESRVSHASLWTSMYPAQHHFIAEKAKLNPQFITLAEAIKPSGLYTAGFMANGFIDAFWGFAEGFDLLHNHIHEGGGLRAEDLVKAAKGFLATRGQRPFFLYLGTIDAHVSWRAHAPWINRYDPEPYSGPFQKACLDPQLENIVTGKLRVTDRDKTRIIALYDSDVSYNDQQFGELQKLLAQGGHSEDTMVILSADHGDELWDHGKVGHGQSLREELVHTPLGIYYPPLFPGR